jgi:hypothetical protein
MRGASHVIDDYFILVNVKKKNVEIRKKLEAMEAESRKIVELERENQRLKDLLGLVQQKPNEMIAARVIGEDVMNWFKCIIIDKGRNSGVKEKMPVVTPLGVVGRAVDKQVAYEGDGYQRHNPRLTSTTGKHTRGIGRHGKDGPQTKLFKNDDMRWGSSHSERRNLP